MRIMDWFMRKILPSSVYDFSLPVQPVDPAAEAEEAIRKTLERRQLKEHIAAISAEVRMHERLLK